MAGLYARLAFEFAKISLFAVGGGLATLPFLYDLARRSAELFSETAIPDMLAVAQILPGAIGVNMVSQAGLQAAGPAGSAVSVIAFLAPQVTIIVIIAGFLEKFKANSIVKAVFRGLRPASCGLLAAAGFGVWKLCLWRGWPVETSGKIELSSIISAFTAAVRWKETLIFAAIFAGVVVFKKHPALYIAAGAAAGLALL